MGGINPTCLIPAATWEKAVLKVSPSTKMEQVCLEGRNTILTRQTISNWIRDLLKNIIFINTIISALLSLSYQRIQRLQPSENPQEIITAPSWRRVSPSNICPSRHLSTRFFQSLESRWGNKKKHKKKVCLVGKHMETPIFRTYIWRCPKMGYP